MTHDDDLPSASDEHQLQWARNIISREYHATDTAAPTRSPQTHAQMPSLTRATNQSLAARGLIGRSESSRFSARSRVTVTATAGHCPAVTWHLPTGRPGSSKCCDSHGDSGTSITLTRSRSESMAGSGPGVSTKSPSTSSSSCISTVPVDPCSSCGRASAFKLASS